MSLLTGKNSFQYYFGNIELKKYLFYLIPFLCSSVVFCVLYLSFGYEYSTDQKLDLQNKIDIQYAYTLKGGILSVLGFSDDRFTTRHPISIKSDEVLKPLTSTVFLPYYNSNEILLSFDAGESDVILHRIFINDIPLDLKNYEQSLKFRNVSSVKYSDELKSLIVSLSDAKNQIRLSDKVMNTVPKYSKKEIEKLNKESAKNRFYEKVKVLLCFFFLFLLLSFVIIRSKIYNYLNAYIAIILILALDFSFILSIKGYVLYLNENDVLGNLFKFHQNYLPLFWFLFLFPLFISGLLKSKIVSTFTFVVSLLSLLILVGDNFVISILDSRYIFKGSGLFIKQAEYSYPFIVKYLMSDAGILMLISFVLFIYVSLLGFKFKYKLGYKSICSCSLILVAYLFYPVDLNYNDYKFSNVFQVNNISFINRGNYQVNFSKDYPVLKDFDFKWQTKKGLNLRKNVIILLVESLDCSLTYSCGSVRELTPNITKLASENVFFDKYYSNNFNTHGAYLTVIKSIPFFPPKDLVFSQSLIKLYDHNDLVEAFKKFGYTTSFFSSTDMVYGMDVTVSLSDYDNVFTEKDPYFSNVTDRYVFNSVPDENLYEYIAYRAKLETKPFLYVTKSASSHTPFSSPFGLNDFDKSFEYTDVMVDRFVKLLRQNGFFKNGILIITGDHKAWDNQHGDLFSVSKNRSAGNLAMVNNHVPLILIDDIHKGKVNHTVFSHSSLGVFLQSLLLPEYKLNRFNADVIVSTHPEVILHYENEKRNYVLVKVGDLEDEVILNGDRSEFLNHVFEPQLERLILAYIARSKDGED